MRFLRFIIGLLLLPVCVVLTQTGLSLMAATAHGEASAMVPAPVLAIGGGYFLWILLYFTLPLPVRTYVLAHELTHALWGAVMGARVSKLRVGRDQGSVTLSKTNVWITLAPYFFPLYTVLVMVSYLILGRFYNLERYELLWLGLIGFTWGFHFTFTVTALTQSQSDVRVYGYLFSYSLIYALNMLGICLWIAGISRVAPGEAMATLGFHGRSVWAACLEGGMQLWQYFGHYAAIR